MGMGGLRHRWAIVAAALALGLAGCSPSADESPAPDADTPSDSAARSVETTSTTEAEATVPALADPTLDPEGVIVAAVLLHTDGDLEMALADGAFTRRELDAARDGLADGSLDYLFD